MRLALQALATLAALVLLIGVPQTLAAQDPGQDRQGPQDQDQQDRQGPQDQDQQQQDQQPPQGQQPSGPPYEQQSPEQLQQLVAPIALYPDSLVAQILAASTFPEQIVEADRWAQSHQNLKGEALGQAVDPMPWDPSVKALAAFPSVLGNMDKNLSWTSSLGDAYYNQEQDVMDAVQVMRRRAQQAGNLNSTSQQTVTSQDNDIEIAPASPDIVYVPAYDPWVIYGGPIVAWPGWYPYPGIWYDGPSLFFGVGFGIGFFGGYGWGWGHWGFDWHNHYAVYDHGRYYSHSRTFYNRDAFYRGGHGGRDFRVQGGEHGERGRGEINRGEAGRGEVGRGEAGRGQAGRGDPRAGGRADYGRAGGGAQPFGGDRGAARGYAEPHGQSGTHSSAFSGYNHGGEERGFSSRGSSSFGGGGGGGSHGGGGGRH